MRTVTKHRNFTMIVEHIWFLTVFLDDCDDLIFGISCICVSALSYFHQNTNTLIVMGFIKES